MTVDAPESRPLADWMTAASAALTAALPADHFGIVIILIDPDGIHLQVQSQRLTPVGLIGILQETMATLLAHPDELMKAPPDDPEPTH